MGLAAWVLGVLLFNAYAALLVILRGRIYRVRVYRPMLVNIGLSLAPLGVAVAGIVVMLVVAGLANMAPESMIVGTLVAFWSAIAITTAVWLLAFPNSAYLITELNMSHRTKDDPVPLWFDIVSVLTLTLSGLLNSTLSLGIIHLFTLVILDTSAIAPGSWAMAIGVLALGSFGIYLGRYLRFNSWDVRHPTSMARKLAAYFRGKGKLADASGFVVTHTLLLALLYVPLFVLLHQALFNALAHR